MAQQAASTVQIVNRIDERNLVTLKGNTLPVANARNDRGRVSPSLPMNDLVLVLSRSPQQQAAFDKFVASQYEAGSPNYHQWLEPEEVGAKFGPAQSDIDTVSAWLAGHGFSTGEVSKDRMTIRFSGTAAQVESAFHTQIHNIEVKGVQHIANMSDPQIPAALAPAVVGIKSLHNFFPKPMHRLGSQVELNRTTGKWQRVASPASDETKSVAAARKVRPQFGTTDSYGDVIEDVTPYDFGAIYNVTPLWKASSPINGKGQTIAIAGTSKIDSTDVTTFRQAFGVAAFGSLTNDNNSFTTEVGNNYDPGVCTSTSSTALCGIGDLTENSLDVEWSGAVAPGASIVLVASGYNSQTNPTNDPVYDSANYIVSNKTGNILNVSYGQCELFEGTAGNVSYYNLWQSAATEGISVFVSSGDSGSASCDQGGDSNGTPYAAEYGLTVSGLASTPYNTAVGGTDFNWCPASSTSCTAAPYWGTNSSTTQANALGYVPEIPWNDTCASPTGIAYAQYWANQLNTHGYSATSPTTSEASCNFYVEWYQIIYANTNPATDISVFVDTVGGSGGQSSCVANTATTTSATCTTGATTTGTANGSIPLYNNGWPKPSWQANSSIPGYVDDGVRDIPDVSFFAATGVNGSAYLICVSANSNPCTYTGDADKTPLLAQEVGGTSVASPAMAGVMALINQKAGSAQGNPNSELYSLAAKQTYSSCSAETVTTSSSCYFNDIDQYTNAQPCDDGDFGYTSPNCSVITVGDGVGILANTTTPSLGGYTAVKGYDMATGLGSLNVANVVNAWTSTTSTPTFALTNNAAISVAAGATTGNTSTLSVTPSDGFTGTVNLTCAVTTSPSGATSPVTCGVPSSVNITGTAAATATLTVSSTTTTTTGAYVVTVTGKSGSLTETTTVNVTVTTAVSTGSFALTNSGAISVAAGASTGNTSTISVTPSGGFTGAVALTCAITPTAASSPATCALSPTSVTISGATAQTSTLKITTTDSTTTGTYTVTVTGTSGTTTETTPVTLTVTTAAPTGSFALTNSGNITVTAGATSGNTSTISVTPSGGFTGTVALTCAVTPTAANDPATCSLSPASVDITGTSALTSTLTVSTTAPTSALNRTNKLFWPSAGGTALALVFLLGIPRRRRNWLAILGLLVLFVSIAAVGCGGSSSSSGNPGTTTGTYTVTVTGTVGTTTETTPVTLTVN
jgi:hypothetical protein